MRPGIKFSKKLYIGESVRKKQRRIKWRLAHYAGFASLHVLIMPRNDVDQLEIMHAGFLKQQYYKDYPPFIVGFAGDYDEAIELVEDIANETYCSTGGLDIRSYIMEGNGTK